MSQITRRSMVLGSVAVTVTASGLVLSATEAEAGFNLGGVLTGIGNAIGGAVVHGATSIAQGVGQVLQVAPQLINTAANTAAQVVGVAAPLAGQIAGIGQQIAQFPQNQIYQQLPIFCNPNANPNPFNLMPGISNQPMQLGGVAQQAIMQDPTHYMMNNLQSIMNQLIPFLLQGQPLPFTAPSAVTTTAGTTPTYTPFGVPYIGSQGQNGIFPALLGFANLALGGNGLLSLLSLL